MKRSIRIGEYKLVWFDNCYDWLMTGIIGPQGKWFLGLSINKSLRTRHPCPADWDERDDIRR